LFNNVDSSFRGRIFVPLTSPVAPIPDLVTYCPTDYYEIPKMVDPLFEAKQGTP